MNAAINRLERNELLRAGQNRPIAVAQKWHEPILDRAPVSTMDLQRVIFKIISEGGGDIVNLYFRVLSIKAELP